MGLRRVFVYEGFWAKSVGNSVQWGYLGLFGKFGRFISLLVELGFATRIGLSSIPIHVCIYVYIRIGELGDYHGKSK